jgi:PleD family two-component response regulator
LPETGYAGAGIVVERIKNSIAGVSKDNNRPVNASIGVVTCIQPPDSLDELLRLVDGFMYMAKNLGKNQIKHEIWEKENKRF